MILKGVELKAGDILEYIGVFGAYKNKNKEYKVTAVGRDLIIVVSAIGRETPKSLDELEFYRRIS